MNPTNRLHLRQPLILSVCFAVLLGVVSVGLGTTPAVNLWSLQYLWAQSTPVFTPLSIFAADKTGYRQTPPENHINGYVWLAREALAEGSPLRAQQLVAPALASDSQEAKRIEAMILFTQQRYDEALRSWAEVGDIEELLWAGQELTTLKQQTKAYQAYELAYQLSPERSVLPIAQLMWQEQGHSREAKELLGQYITQSPSSRYYFDWLGELAEIYQSEGAFAQAIAIYQETLAIAPDRRKEWLALGWLYAERGDDIDSVIQQFDRAIALDPEKGEGYFAKAERFYEEQRYAEAEHWYTEAIRRAPEQTWWYLRRANVVLKRGEVVRALKFFSDAQQRFPTSAQVHYQAAAAYQSSGDKQQAVAAIESAVHLLQSEYNSPTLMKINFFVRAGEIYEWSGQLQKALNAYQQAAALAPNDSTIQTNLKRVQ